MKGLDKRLQPRIWTRLKVKIALQIIFLRKVWPVTTIHLIVILIMKVSVLQLVFGVSLIQSWEVLEIF